MDVKKLLNGIIVALAFAFVLALPVNVKAEYSAYVIDNADLLTYEEEEMLKNDMAPILQYGGVAFVSNSEAYAGDADSLAKRYCYELFNKESGTVFLIDMFNRRIQIYSTGKIYNTINKTWANSITDNIYTYATDGDYYGCAKACFNQMTTILEGGKVSVPMKYVSNLFFAFGFSLIIVFLLTYVQRAKNYGREVKQDTGRRNAIYKDKGDAAVNARGFRSPHVALLSKTMTKEVKTLHSEGGSGGGSSGGGGGGGGSSGGGGGHGF